MSANCEGGSPFGKGHHFEKNGWMSRHIVNAFASKQQAFSIQAKPVTQPHQLRAIVFRLRKWKKVGKSGAWLSTIF